jgi:hypothetical protein
LLVMLGSGTLAACRFDVADRWLAGADTNPGDGCTVGQRRCAGAVVQECQQLGDGPRWTQRETCGGDLPLCVATLGACGACTPGVAICQGQTVVGCGDDARPAEVLQACEPEDGYVCREGKCDPLCTTATKTRSNVGCEYWAADLDNANVGTTTNAAAQQFAIVISNPTPDAPVRVTITQDDGLGDEEIQPVTVASASIGPKNLQVFKLGPREVDGSPPGEFDTGTHTAKTRQAFRIQSSLPVVAYQFNPLENANVFSNDASLLKPVSAIPSYPAGEVRTAYVVVGWPQTIASTDDPETNFSSSDPSNLRAFLTLIGTREDTFVRVRPTAKVVGGGVIPETPPGGIIETTLRPYEVLNLETGDFNADFTGTIVESDGAVVAFSGSEASDAPFFQRLSERFCCADHLEEQLDPLRTAGQRFVGAKGPSRTKTLVAAGAFVGIIKEPDYYRIVNASNEVTHVQTTLPAPDDSFDLDGLGAFRSITALQNFVLEADQAVHVGNVSPSQEAAGIKRGLPGGDPSLLIVPPVEQWRLDYVFLTPDRYAFDFVTIVAPPDAVVRLDGAPLDPTVCEEAPADGLTNAQRGGEAPPYVVYTCQLGFAVVDPTKSSPENLTPGEQDDGTHRLEASAPVGLLVSGFDSFVSYSYAGGTDLRELRSID